MPELHAQEGDAVSALLHVFQNNESFPFYAEASGVAGSVWFDCQFGDIPRKDSLHYSNMDEWLVFAGAVILSSGSLWGVRALRLRPGDNAIDVLGKDVSDQEYTLIDSFHGIHDIVAPD